MSSEYPQAPIGKVAKVRSGFAFKSSDWQNDGIPVVKIANVKDGRLEMDGCSYVSNEVALTAKDFLLDEGDILISMTGYVGDLARVRIEDTPCALNQRVGRFHSYNRELIDPSFLFYHLRSKETRSKIEQKAYGSAQPNISAGGIEETCVYLPELKDQQAIAHILGTLDDKIELNRKTNETLEAMAKALFKSWFVDFDPVRAKVEGRSTGLPAEISDLFPDSFEDSELGEIPNGWEIKKIGEVVTRLPVGKRFDQKTVLPSGSTPVLDQSAGGIVGFHNEEAGIAATRDAPLFTFANHTCAMRYMIRPFSVIQNVFPLGGNGVDTAWLYQASRGKQKITEYKGHYPDFVEKQIVVPSNGLDRIYGSDYHSILLKCDSNLLDATFLASVRDALLPKLISGEIRIPDAEKMLEEVGV